MTFWEKGHLEQLIPFPPYHMPPTLWNVDLFMLRILTAYKKPWRFMICNWLDILLLTGLMVIVDMGAVTMRDSPQTAMIICALARET